MNILRGSVFRSTITRLASLAAVGVAILFSSETQAGLIASVEAPGVQTSTALDKTVIDFNRATTGYHYNQTFTAGALTVTYSGDQFILSANQYGGAVDPASGHDTQYLADTSGNVTMTLSAPQAYFGLWVSAADAFNQLYFYLDSKLVDSFTQTLALLDRIPSGPLPTGYNGNPTADFLGYNPRENICSLISTLRKLPICSTRSF